PADPSKPQHPAAEGFPVVVRMDRHAAPTPDPQPERQVSSMADTVLAREVVELGVSGDEAVAASLARTKEALDRADQSAVRLAASTRAYNQALNTGGKGPT